MICYHESLSEAEILALNDYWLLSNETYSGFQYTVQEITSFHRGRLTRGISTVAGYCSFVASDLAFFCPSCRRKKPVSGRREYSRRMKIQESEPCSVCLEEKRQRLSQKAQEILDAFKAEYFQPTAYLEELSMEESLALLSISSGLSDNSLFLGDSPENIEIAGCEVLDRNFLVSLLTKKAITVVNEIPPKVAEANRIVFGQYDRVTYDHQSRNVRTYKHPDSVTPGFYLNTPIIDGEINTSGTASLIYQNLQTSSVSPAEATKLHHIIKEIQLDKMYRMTREISKEYELIIDNSNTLRALLDHLAEHYAPQHVYFTFNIKAKETIVHIHKAGAPPYIEKHFFSKFVGDYIQFIENKGWELKKAWRLPPSIQTSPFEALFSQIYLDGHFDWNRISTKEIVALWLKNARLSAEAQDLLVDEGS